MPERIHPTRPRSQALRRSGAAGALALLLAAVGLIAFHGGCAEKGSKTEGKTEGKNAAAVSDTSAYRAAAAVTDTTARISAFEAFLTTYPSSPFRANAFSRLYDMKAKRNPEQAVAFVRDHLQTEKDPAARGRLYYSLYVDARDYAPEKEASVLDALKKDRTPDDGVYNMVAWDLVERGKSLDDAVELAGIGAEKASDSLSKSSVLDTKGWAYFTKGDYPNAVQALEQAVAFAPEDEVRGHLAEAYDKAGQTEKARDLYAALLILQEDPEMRARVRDLTRKMNGSVPEVFGKIDRDRKAASKPASDFALKDYDGKEIKLSDYRGKVVLLSFWHPT
jgi:tetratricopeptide (TPR) repeat protein